MREQKYVEYFRCALAHSHNCTAEKRELFHGKEDTVPLQVTVISSHCHAPPHSPRPSKQLIVETKKQLLANRSPADIERDLIATATPATIGSIPSKEQMQQMKYYLKSKCLPSGDSIKNIIGLFRDKFLRLMQLHPKIHIVLVSAESCDLLANTKYNQTIFVDGTFNVAELGLSLTTVMLIVERVNVPVAWFLSDGATAADYAVFFTQLKELTRNAFRPITALVDFELAIHNALRQVFPEISVLGDAFHFVQANTRWLLQNNLNHLRNDAISALRTLWTSKTVAQFTNNLQAFLQEWNLKAPNYSSYFQQQWLQKTQSTQWALYGRVDTVPSGDNALEGWHNRWKRILAEHHRLPIDRLVAELWKENVYYHNLLASEKIKSTVELKERQQERRVTLTDVIARTGVIDTQNSPATTQPIQPQSVQPIIGPGICNCGRGVKINKQCSQRKCSACCVASREHCSVANHLQPKCKRHFAATIDIVERAMKDQSTIWIRYTNATGTTSIRGLIPNSWAVLHGTFTSLCPIEGTLKSFSIARVEKIAEAQFDY